MKESVLQSFGGVLQKKMLKISQDSQETTFTRVSYNNASCLQPYCERDSGKVFSSKLQNF